MMQNTQLNDAQASNDTIADAALSIDINSKATAIFKDAINEFNLKRHQTCLLKLEEYIQLKPHVWDAHNLKAACLATLGNAEAAEKVWLYIVAQAPDYTQAYNNLGLYYQKQNDLEKAGHYLQQALQLNSQNSDAYLNLGLVQFSQQNYEHAIELYKQSLAINPKNALAQFNIGASLQRINRFDESLLAYEQALRIDSTHLDSLLNGVFCYHYSSNYQAHEVRARTERLVQPFFAQMTPQQTHRLSQKKWGEPLKVGLLSADFKVHPVGFFLQNVLTHLQQFPLEIYAYASVHFEEKNQQGVP